MRSLANYVAAWKAWTLFQKYPSSLELSFVPLFGVFQTLEIEASLHLSIALQIEAKVEMGFESHLSS